MEKKEYSETLILLKLDLSISHDKKDDYFEACLESADKELEEKGIDLNLKNVEDQMLLSDYTAWRYRNREKEVGISRNLNARIMNRKVKGRVERNVQG